MLDVATRSDSHPAASYAPVPISSALGQNLAQLLKRNPVIYASPNLKKPEIMRLVAIVIRS